MVSHLEERFSVSVQSMNISDTEKLGQEIWKEQLQNHFPPFVQ